MSSDIIDIEESVKVFAWNVFLKTRSKEHQKLSYQDCSLEVKWDRVKFLSQEPVFEKDEDLMSKPKSQVVFKSSYVNRSNSEQEHCFKTERTTVSTCTTTISKGYTKGFNLEIKLAVPGDVAEVTAGFGKEINVEREDETTQEESMTWSVDSTVRVPAGHKTVAELVVREQSYSGKFNMQVQVRGKVHVVITNLRDNNSFVQSIESDFSQIMSKERENGKKGFVIEGKMVKWNVEGKCGFKYGIEQHVEVSEEKI